MFALTHSSRGSKTSSRIMSTATSSTGTKFHLFISFFPTSLSDIKARYAQEESKTRIASRVLVGANMDGSEKLKLLVIGKAATASF